MYTITQKIEIAAGAIQYNARKNFGINAAKGELSKMDAHGIWEEMHSQGSGTVAGAFLMEATEKQFKRVINLAVKRTADDWDYSFLDKA